MELHAVVSAPDALQRLHAGEISLEQYLDERVEIALCHVAGLVSEGRLAPLRELLREYVRNDPAIVEVVERAPVVPARRGYAAGGGKTERRSTAATTTRTRCPC